MEKILLRLNLEEHKGHERIFAWCNYHPEINKILREIPGSKFSATRRGWHFPPVKELVEILKEKIKDLAQIDVQPLRKRLIAKKQLPVLVQTHIAKPDITSLSINNSKALERYIETLLLKAYAPSTIRTYRNEFYQLLKEIKDIHVQDLTADHIRRYMSYCFNKYNLSEATANSRINAIKFYFEQVLGR